jgi:type I restriction enzyme S subunit
MTENWKNIKLGDAATFVNGYAFKPSDWSESGLEIIRIQNLTKGASKTNFYEGDIADKYKVEAGDLLISWSATLGIYEWTKEDAWLNQHIFKVVFDKEEFDKSFFKHLISSLLVSMKRQVHGATMQHITKKKFDAIQIPLPPLATQKKIAAILDAADKHSTTTAALITKYTDLAQSLFLDMFGDINKNVKHSLGTVGDVTQLVKDGPHTSPKYSLDGIPILSTRNIRPYQLILEGLKYVSDESYQELTRRFKPQRGDILLTKGGTTGYAKVVDWDWDFCIWVHLAALRVDQSLTNPKYLEGALNSYYAYHQSQLYTRGIANKDLGLKRLIKIEIPIPSLTLQNQFAERVQAIEVQKKQAEDALVKAEELFQSLLQQAFLPAGRHGNGELV